MNYKIIITLGEEELKNYKNSALVKADILEIRLDLLSSHFVKENLAEILKELAKPVIFTYRNPKDSSESMNTKFSYEDLAELLLEFNIEKNYLDIEFDQQTSIFDSIPNNRFTMIYSYHNFSSSISKDEMLEWISKKELPKAIYKFAVSPRNANELEIFLNDIVSVSENHRIIGIAMGEIGIYSRIFGDYFRSFATYCCLGKPRAPGQVSISTLQKIREEYKDKPLPKISSIFPIESSK